MMVDAAGGVADTLRYDAFGALVSQSGATAATHRFAGEVADPESGLVYLRARYYDPATGTFLSRDPLQGDVDNPLSRNRYAYALDNPVNRRDPTGQETLVEVNFASAQSVALDAQNVLSKRKALQQTKEVVVDAARITGGIMAVESVMEYFSAGPATVRRWFGSGKVVELILDLVSNGLGETIDSGVEIAASLGMSKMAYDMLGGRTTRIVIQGVGIFLAGSVDEAMSQFKADLRYSTACAKPDDIAFALRSENIIEICTRGLTMPPLPSAATITRGGYASLPGLFVHEYSHISLGSKDPHYGCTTGAAAYLRRIPGNALLNADSYRCWAEDTSTGGSGSTTGPAPQW
jgi:RHS repeat-associated protein